jgi:putative flavoprotein involved in K+ transport
MDAPEEKLPDLRDGYDEEELHEVFLKLANITSVIWATGYGFDFSMVRLPVLDSDGYPVQKRGVTALAGLYFASLPWLHNGKSGLLFGAGQDAAYIARIISSRAMRELPKRQSDEKRFAQPVDSVYRPSSIGQEDSPPSYA